MSATTGRHPEESVPLTDIQVDRRTLDSRGRTQSLGDVIASQPDGSAPTNGAGKHNRSSSHTNKGPMRPYYKSHSRRKLFRSKDNMDFIAEPEIEPVESPTVSDPGIETTTAGEFANESERSVGKEKTFCTKYKLERGTLSAFKREARNIIDRDLPHISHKDNIIRVFKEKGHAHLFSPRTQKWSSVLRLERKLKYYFQHPYLRLFVSYFVILCNLLLFAEDPVSHSKREADIPVFGNVFSFIFLNYPSDWRWRFLKVSMWLLAIGCGLVVGKTVIHGIVLSRFLRLKMFRANQGSWMVQFFTVIVSLFLFSHVYNLILLITWPSKVAQYSIDSMMYFTHSTVMKIAACGTWLGCLITALIITDMMLQDNLYPSWAPKIRKFWQTHSAPRILLFWVGSILVTAAVVTVIATDWITWDRLNRDFFHTTELSRAFLASFILVMDLTIVMQDWDFPHFTNTLDVNLPGFHKHEISFTAVEIEISGKWFNYGIIFLVMLFDLNMWKNQIFYYPSRYGQYTGIQNRVFTVTNQTVLETNNPELWTYEARSQINPDTNLPYIDEDLPMYSRFMGYSMWIKSMAFIPSVVGFIVFFILIAAYGRINKVDKVSDQDEIHHHHHHNHFQQTNDQEQQHEQEPVHEADRSDQQNIPGSGDSQKTVDV